MKKVRLDAMVAGRANLAIETARAVVRAGQVYSTSGDCLDKPGLLLPEGVEIDIRQSSRFVSRGGEKLDAAIRHFQLEICEKTALDVGCSTGGFTDCLLQHGAAHVYAVDVGYGQLAWKLRTDPRVTVMERTNARLLTREHFPVHMDVFAADCSFISLKAILPVLVPLLAPEAFGVALIKPQFEAERHDVEPGGVVRDEATRRRIVDEILAFCSGLGFAQTGVIPSPLVGPAGNVEYLACISRGARS